MMVNFDPGQVEMVDNPFEDAASPRTPSIFGLGG